MINHRVARNGNNTTPSTAPTRADEGKKRFMPITSQWVYCALPTRPSAQCRTAISRRRRPPTRIGLCRCQECSSGGLTPRERAGGDRARLRLRRRDHARRRSVPTSTADYDGMGIYAGGSGPRCILRVLRRDPARSGFCRAVAAVPWVSAHTPRLRPRESMSRSRRPRRSCTRTSFLASRSSSNSRGG